jgi:aspartate aminotransferase
MKAEEGAPLGRVSTKAAGMVGSEILKIAGDIRAMTAEGKQICNLTVGDFSPSEFRIPRFLEENIREAYQRGETNYPPSDGMLVLRKAILSFYERRLGLRYPVESVLVTGGSRPGIYAAYQTVVNPGDPVVYPVPSWNNNHYSYLTGAAARPVHCTRDHAFLPTRAQLAEQIRGARLLALNSPLNPTGTAFAPDVLEEICDLVLEENARRSHAEGPLYFLYDMVYWMLTYGSTVHCNPVSLRPALAPYTILIDGISKPFAATGVRVGWTVGPTDVIARMAAMLGHIGAWAPRAEQIATARLLSADDQMNAYHASMKRGVQERLDALYAGIQRLRNAGHPVDAIPPMGAIYLSARFALNGKPSRTGKVLCTNEEIRQYLLQEAGLAIVPFQAFGAQEDTGWFRLSVGSISLKEIEAVLPRLEAALEGMR